MYSGRPFFSPAIQELIDQVVDIVKLDIAQGLAFEQEPNVFRSLGVERNPSPLGKVVAQRLRALKPGTKRQRGDYSKALPVNSIYNEEVRSIARRMNVDVFSNHPVVDQIDKKTRFAFVAEDLRSETRIGKLYDDLFSIEIDAGGVRDEVREMRRTTAATANTDPAVARMVADRAARHGAAAATALTPATVAEVAPVATVTMIPGIANIVLNRGLHFRLHRVKCVDETNPEWWGDDEIGAGGVAINWDSESSEISEFRVGNSFDDGESKTYDPPRVMKSFSLDGATYPCDFSVVMALAEKDNGGLSKFIEDLWDAIKSHVDAILKAVGTAAGLAAGTAVGGATGTAIGGPLGALIGAALGAILGALIGWLISALKDDIFEPQAAALHLPNSLSAFSGGSLTSPLMTLDFRDFGGHYRAYYSWRLIRDA